MLKSLILILFSITLAIGGQFLLKNGMTQVGRIGSGTISYYTSMLIKTFMNPYVLIGLLFYAVSSVFWLIVLSRVDLSYAYPFAGLGYVIVMAISWRFLDEPVSLIRLIGALLICLGVIFVSRS